jgi:2-(1,2-epoxy-1,2-dihydrophenyl)acetyl-CoA isomerase
MFKTITFDVASNGVATLAFNRPDNFNGMNAEMSDELMSVLYEVHRRPDLRVLVLTGSGRSFCPGADINGFNAGETSDAEVRSPAITNIATPSLLHGAPVPTIAAVNGACAGAGFGLACACDIRVAARSAVFRSAFLSVGVAGDNGVPWSLPRLIGAAKAKEISFLDAKFSAEAALATGLVSQVFDDDAFRSEVELLASRLAAGPPLGTRSMKANYLAAERVGFDDFIDLEFQRHFHLITTDDAIEGFRAFGERRTPRFTGH